ncbi:DAK2 domain-containing protein, partial [Clavibacter nebraskensis]
LGAAADAAARGAKATEPLVARKGRASYLGERAIGHRDPGAQSSALLLRAAAAMARDAEGAAS